MPLPLNAPLPLMTSYVVIQTGSGCTKVVCGAVRGHTAVGAGWQIHTVVTSHWDDVMASAVILILAMLAVSAPVSLAAIANARKYIPELGHTPSTTQQKKNCRLVQCWYVDVRTAQTT